MTRVKALEHKEMPIFGIFCNILHELNHVLTVLIVSTALELDRADLGDVDISHRFSGDCWCVCQQ
jgi:hypothetical protein